MLTQRRRDFFSPVTAGRQLVILTTVFIVTLVGILTYTIITIQDQSLDAVVVDIAGRQRMLNQRHMKEVFLVSQNMQLDYPLTRKTINESLEALIHGGTVVINEHTGETADIPEAPNQAILHKREEQKNLVAEITVKADAFLQLPNAAPSYTASLQTLLALNAQLHDAADRAVKLFSSNSQSKISRMIHWEIGIGSFAACLGVLLARQVGRANRELGNEVRERARAEKDLRHRVAMENLVSTLSTQFINLPVEALDSGIENALKTIGEFAGVDRSYIFQFSEGGQKMDNTHEWCAEGIDPQRPRLRGLSTNAFPWFYTKILANEIIYIPDVAELPPEASAERREFEIGRIKSLLNVPMSLGNTVVGFLGFDSVRSPQFWSDEDIGLLQMVGEICVSALKRKRDEENLRKSEALRLDALRQSDALKSALLSSVSHELRTPLTAMKASIDSLVADDSHVSPSMKKEFLNGINREIDYLNRLVDNLLDMSRIEAVALVPDRE